VAGLDGLADGAALLDGLRRHVEGVAAQFDGLVSERGERLSNDPDILSAQLAAMGFAPDEALRRVADWRSAARGRCARPQRAWRSRQCFPI
jgi:glutamate-ammonia-ligase adenylyltransferase